MEDLDPYSKTPLKNEKGKTYTGKDRKAMQAKLEEELGAPSIDGQEATGLHAKMRPSVVQVIDDEKGGGVAFRP